LSYNPALHTGGAWLLMCYWVRCFEARPGPAPRRVPYPQFRGYRTKRVGFMVTFRLAGAEKSVLKLVGANLKDGQNVLVL